MSPAPTPATATSSRDDHFSHSMETTLANCESDAVLLEVEQLFDGGTLYFYFLGELTPEVESLVQGSSDTEVVVRSAAIVVVLQVDVCRLAREERVGRMPSPCSAAS